MAGASQGDRAGREAGRGHSQCYHCRRWAVRRPPGGRPVVGIELHPIEPRDACEIERALAVFAREPNGGLIVTSSAAASTHRALIVMLTARYRLPAVYPQRLYVTAGGLASYRYDVTELDRLAADYVDRILKGEKPADPPVMQPTKFELLINLKTAKALGLTVPQTLLVAADEIIE